VVPCLIYLHQGSGRIFYVLSWTVTVKASNRVGHPLKDVCSCWQEFGGIQWRCHCVQAEQGESRKAALSTVQGGCWLESREGYAANFPSVTVRQLQGVSAAKVYITREPNYGACCGEIDSQWGSSVCTLQWNPHLMFCFSDPKSVLSVLNSLHLRFPSLYYPNTFLPKETLNMGFTVIRFSLVWTLSG
jgi:hypothetical protein